jgi:hypothetical protein
MDKKSKNLLDSKSENKLLNIKLSWHDYKENNITFPNVWIVFISAFITLQDLLIWFLSIDHSFIVTTNKHPHQWLNLGVRARYKKHIKYLIFIHIACKDLQNTIISIKHQAKIEMKNQLYQVVKNIYINKHQVKLVIFYHLTNYQRTWL